jgi:hypothetical protein
MKITRDIDSFWIKIQANKSGEITFQNNYQLQLLQEIRKYNMGSKKKKAQFIPPLRLLIILYTSIMPVFYVIMQIASV